MRILAVNWMTFARNVSNVNVFACVMCIDVSLKIATFDVTFGSVFQFQTNTVHWIHTQTHAQPHTNGKITASRRKKNWRVNKAYEIISLSVKFLGCSLFSCNLVVCSFSDFISSSIWWVYHPVHSLNSVCTPFFLAFSIISSCFDLFGLSLWTLWRWNIHIFYANKWKWSIDQI